jgi:hypothetical protein
VHWVGQDPSIASWVNLKEFKHLFLSFKLGDELHFEGGRDVMVGLRYTK